ncbi:DUF2505 family protein [Pendulispora albinea]|uniref:DUF2505 family protein n=1 Tax=Pendulispora albinea TaxID=2741071 RepID=A0ABZ2LWI5_9BACT
MRFEITHEFEAPLDALELAILSPNLVDKMAKGLPNVDRVEQTTHKLHNRVLERIWNYKPNVKVPTFAQPYVTLDMLAWDERSTYSIDTHSSKWIITPSLKPEWQKYFRASGTYSLVTGGNGVTSRVVQGEVELNVTRVLKQLGERVIVSEVKKTFDAEARILRDLATLV